MKTPSIIWFVRHGQSAANLARHRAEAQKALTIDFEDREPDVPLTADGIEQSTAVGHWFKFQTIKPTVIFTSPFVRTSETARLISANAGFEGVETVFDERLRERELGIFDRLTRLGAMQKHPEECAKRELLGKFYYRPPGGENWADVALRLRSFWRDLNLYYANERVLIVTHEVVIRVFRYVVEKMTEAEILAVDRAGDVENGAISTYEVDAQRNKFSLKLDNYLPEQ